MHELAKFCFFSSAIQKRKSLYEGIDHATCIRWRKKSSACACYISTGVTVTVPRILMSAWVKSVITLFDNLIGTREQFGRGVWC